MTAACGWLRTIDYLTVFGYALCSVIPPPVASAVRTVVWFDIHSRLHPGMSPSCATRDGSNNPKEKPGGAGETFWEIALLVAVVARTARHDPHSRRNRHTLLAFLATLQTPIVTT